MSTPFYLKPTDPADIAGAVVAEGCALLFLNEGRLMMKLSDGSITEAATLADVAEGSENAKKYAIIFG